jgi:hypothetical protein
LVERHFAFLAKPASGAFGASPDSVVAFLDLVDRLLVGCDDAHLEVAASITFRAKTGSGPIRAPQVDEPRVYDDCLEMHARAHAHFQTSFDERRLRVETSTKGA